VKVELSASIGGAGNRGVGRIQTGGRYFGFHMEAGDACTNHGMHK